MGIGDLMPEGETLETLFEHFGVSYEPSLLAVHRLHVLRRFGLGVAELARREPTLDAAARRRQMAALLARTYALCVDGAVDRAAVFPGLRRGLVTLGRCGGGTRAGEE